MRQNEMRIRQLTELANHPDKECRLVAVEHSECPPNLLQLLSDDQWYKIRQAVASHPDCPPKTLRKLAQDRNVGVRAKVAAHPNCPSQSQSGLKKEFGRRYSYSEFKCRFQQSADSAAMYQKMHPLRELKYWSDEGDPEAQLYLARAYYYGDKVSEDRELAMKWYLKAAEQGNAEAQASLGFEYEYSDPSQALKWYRMAAEQNHADAQLGLGLMYYEGSGVERDYVQAAKWLAEAVANGSEIAMWNLALQYQKGQGVPQDFGKAEELYLESLEYSLCGEGYVESLLGDLYQDSNNPDRDIAIALEYYTQGAELGNAEALIKLGEIYGSGLEVEQDEILAYAVLDIAAQNSAYKEDASNLMKSLQSRMSTSDLAKAELVAASIRESSLFCAIEARLSNGGESELSTLENP